MAIVLMLFHITVLHAQTVSMEELKKEEAAIAAMLDSLTKELYRHNYKFKSEVNGIPVNEPAQPLPSDDVIIERLSRIATTIPLTYNQHVRGFIDLYANRRREMMQRMLGLSDIYFPIFESALDKRDMPIELKQLAIVESALNPHAVSRVGATGLWQIMYTTGRMLGLDANTFIDERRDVQLSTEAALNYLDQMYNLYGDWLLVIASYNCGPGNVNKAIRKAGGSKDFWTVYKYLPTETRGYVPAFIAVNYVMKYYKEHGIVPLPVTASFNAIDTVMIYRNLSLQNIAKNIGVDLGELEMLNPALKRKVIPATDNGYPLKLPLNKVATFEQNKNNIFSEDPEQVRVIAATSSLPNATGNKYASDNNTKVFYFVKENETLDMIAGWFDCDLLRLRTWNNIFGNAVNTGQKLMIMVPTAKASFYEKLDTMQPQTKATIWKEKKAEQEALAIKNAVNNNTASETSSSDEKIINGYKVISQKVSYKVKSGDNLSGIASKYNCTVTDIRKWNNLRTSKLFVGQKLYVYQKKKVKVTVDEPKAETASTDSNQLKLKPSDGQHAPGYDAACNCIYYEVKSGDTLWKISQKYPGATVDKIKKVNGLTDGTQIKVGMKLKIEI